MLGEQCGLNSGTVMVEQCDGKVKQCFFGWKSVVEQ